MKTGTNPLLTLVFCALLSPATLAADYFVVLTGLGGEPTYADRFAQRVADLDESLGHVGSAEPNRWVLDADQTTLDAIEELFETLGDSMRPGDRLQLYLVGHGSYDGEAYKFNIDGPDLTGQRLGELLNGLPDSPQLVVAMTSSSGVLHELIDAPERVLITATKSGYERNAPVFGDYWVAGLADAAADINKNELLSAAELYRYTMDQVAAHYESDNLLAPEHAVISDESAATDFVVARVGMLAERELTEAGESLLEERNQLEVEIQALIERRAEIAEDRYFDQLQTLMLELGRIQQRLDNEVGDQDAP